ncbi:hypothetical protein EMCRGX_G017571 [Ephydatia muelleri]
MMALATDLRLTLEVGSVDPQFALLLLRMFGAFSDVLAVNWTLGKPAAFDFAVTSPRCCGTEAKWGSITACLPFRDAAQSPKVTAKWTTELDPCQDNR